MTHAEQSVRANVSQPANWKVVIALEVPISSSAAATNAAAPGPILAAAGSLAGAAPAAPAAPFAKDLRSSSRFCFK